MISTFKVWVVAWSTRDAVDFDDPAISPLQPIGTEPNPEFKVNCAKVGCKDHGSKGWHYGDILAVFSTEEEARVWSSETGNDTSFNIYSADLIVRDK